MYIKYQWQLANSLVRVEEKQREKEKEKKLWEWIYQKQDTDFHNTHDIRALNINKADTSRYWYQLLRDLWARYQ